MHMHINYTHISRDHANTNDCAIIHTRSIKENPQHAGDCSPHTVAGDSYADNDVWSLCYPQAQGWLKPYHPSFEATVAKLKNNNLGLAISFYYRITVIKPQWYPIKAVQ